MKLLDIIRPHFGAISICKAFIGDPRNEYVLDNYDKEGRTQVDANYHLYAKLDLEETGIEYAIVRFEYDLDDILYRIFLDVVFKSEADKRRSHFWVLQDYLSQSEYFDEWPDGIQERTFRNGINDIHCYESEEEFTLEVYSPWESREGTESVFNSSILRTVSNLARREQDDWYDYVKSSTAKKVILKYGRGPEEYPFLWLVVSEEEYKNNSSLFGLHLTIDILKRIMTLAGWEDEVYSWQDNTFNRIILDPLSLEPMDLVQWEISERAKPMTYKQLEEALNDIELLDRERTSPPSVWDESPIG